MKDELIGSKNGENLIDIVNLLSILSLYNSNNESINFSIQNPESAKITDTKIKNFVYNGTWDGRRDLDPNDVHSRIPGDPHILFILNYFDIDLLLSRDIKLLKRCEKTRFKMYFPNTDKFPVFFEEKEWKGEKFDIMKEINKMKN
jgi:hypothetical protein